MPGLDVPNFDILSGPGGVPLNASRGGGLLSFLDPSYQAQQLQNRATELALKRATAFQDGVPTTDGTPGGPIDFDAIARRQIQDGDVSGGAGLLMQGLKLQMLRDPSSIANPTGLGGGALGSSGGLLAGLAPAAGGGMIATGAGGDDYGKAPGGGYAGVGQVGEGGTGPTSSTRPPPAGIDPLDAYAHSIGAIESSNRYDAVGPTGKNGAAPLGRYQVMSSNVGPWTQEVLGQAMSPADFLASPQAQDAVFRAKFGGYVQQYGNPMDAASMWFSGKPLNRAGNAADSLGTTVPAYVRRFAAGLGPAVAALRGDQASAPGQPGAPAGTASSAPVSFGSPDGSAALAAPSGPLAGFGRVLASSQPVTDAQAGMARGFLNVVQRLDPSAVTADQRQAAEVAGQVVSRYEGQNGGGTVHGAPAPDPDAPVTTGNHPFAPGGGALKSAPGTPAPIQGAPGAPAGGFQPINFGGPGVPPQGAPGAPQVPGLGNPPPNVAAALQRLQGRQGSPADAQLWGAWFKGQTQGGQSGSGQASGSPYGAPPAPPGPDLPYLQGKYGQPGGGPAYVTDLLDTARRYALAGEQQAAQSFQDRAKQVQDDLMAVNKARLDLQTHNAELTPEQKQYQQAVQQGFRGTPLDYLNAIASGKADAQAAGRNAQLTQGQKEYQAAVAGGFQGTEADYQAAAAAQRAEGEGQGKYLGALPAKYATEADAARASNDTVDQMLSAAQGFRMGTGSQMEQDARKTLQGAMGFFGMSTPALNAPTASYEDFGKQAGVLTRNVASGVAGQKGVQELQLLNSTLPSPEQSYDGFRTVAASLKGSGDYRIARQQAAQDWLSDPSHRNSLNGFEASFNRNTSPAAFWLNRLRVDQPDLFTQAVRGLGQTDQGRALLAKAKSGMGWAAKQGLF